MGDEMDEKQDDGNLRGLVLSWATVKIHQTVEAIEDSVLESGYSEEVVTLDGNEFELTVWYWKKQQLVRVMGVPVQTEDSPLMMMFQPGTNDERAFRFDLPLAWIPTMREEV